MTRSTSAVLSFLLLTLAFHLLSDPPDAVAAPCPANQNFVVGGTGDPNGVNTPNVPGGPRTNIVYPASISPVGGHVSGDESVRIASDGLRASLRAFRGRCRGSGVTIIGYSLGAVAVSNVCDGLPAYRTTCVTEGNPKRQPTPTGAGIMGVLPTFIPGFTFTGWRAAPAGGPSIVELCNLRDLYCSAVNPLADPLTFAERAFGTYCQQQHGYPAPCIDPVYPQIMVPWAGDVPDLRDLDPLTRQWVPAAPIRINAPYVPTRFGDFLPPVIRDALPAAITNWVPPPLPVVAVDAPADGLAVQPVAVVPAPPMDTTVPDTSLPDTTTQAIAATTLPDVAAQPEETVPPVSPSVPDMMSPSVPDMMSPSVADLVPPGLGDALPAAVADFVPPTLGDAMG